MALFCGPFSQNKIQTQGRWLASCLPYVCILSWWKGPRYKIDGKFANTFGHLLTNFTPFTGPYLFLISSPLHQTQSSSGVHVKAAILFGLLVPSHTRLTPTVISCHNIYVEDGAAWRRVHHCWATFKAWSSYLPDTASRHPHRRRCPVPNSSLFRIGYKFTQSCFRSVQWRNDPTAKVTRQLSSYNSTW